MTVSTVGLWKSLGCYTDVPGRTLTTLMDVGAPLTVPLCTGACYNAGFTLAGTEYASQCFCGMSFSNGGGPATSGCSMACAGDSTTLCGGPDRLNVYNYTGTPTDPEPVTASPRGRRLEPVNGVVDGWTYAGCYIDSAFGRIFESRQPDSNNMTLASCIVTCVAAGYVLAGLQYSVECSCSNELLNGAALADETECQMPCAGNSTQPCGGPSRASVYTGSGEVKVRPVPTVFKTGLPGKWGYTGCIREPAIGPRMLPYMNQWLKTNTVQKCLKQCSDYGYGTAALTVAECWCGDAADVVRNGGTFAPESDCILTCSGDGDHLCGGPERLQLYQWNGTGPQTWGNPSNKGRYEMLIDAPTIPLIATLGINNKVTFLEKFGTSWYPNNTGAYELDLSLVGDPKRAWREMHVKTDVFCAASIILPDKAGRQINIGGWSLASTYGLRLFTPDGSPGLAGSNDWEENPETFRLQDGRWYPSALLMTNGSILVVGGEKESNGAPVPTLEILPAPAGGRTVKYLDYLERTDPWNLYPFLFVLPSENIFIGYYNEARILHKTTLDTIMILPNIPGSVNNVLGGRSYPLEGAAMILPQSAPYTAPLTVLICGGSTAGAGIALDNCVTIAPEVPNARWTIERMPSKRVMPCMVNLPDGKFMIMNGAYQGVAGFGLANDPNFNAVLYDPTEPVNARMSTLANTTIARMYHSEATLLHDGRILVSGSDPEHLLPDGTYKYPQEFRIEVYLPPYLTDGRKRPTYTIKTTDWAYGREYPIVVALGQGLTSRIRVSLIAATSSTHGNTMGSRTIFPAFTCAGTKSIKRAARTYGSRADKPAWTKDDSSPGGIAPSTSSNSSLDLRLKGLVANADSMPPSSDAEDNIDEDMEDGDAPAPKPVYDWMKELMDIDKDADKDDVNHSTLDKPPAPEPESPNDEGVAPAPKSKAPVVSRKATPVDESRSPSPGPSDTESKAPKALKIDGKSKAKDKHPTKIKAPTKKELKDTKVENARITAQRLAHVPRATKEPKHTLKGLLARLTAPQPLGKTERSASPNRDLTDPIVHSKTSPISSFTTLEFAHRAALPHTPTPPGASTSAPLPAYYLDDEDDDEELYDPLAHLASKSKEAQQEARRQELRELKKRAIAGRGIVLAGPSSDDDDLEITMEPPTMHEVAHDEAGQRQAERMNGTRRTTGQNRQLQYAGVPMRHEKSSPMKAQPQVVLRNGARPAWEVNAMGRKERAQNGSRVKPQTLNAILAEGAEKQKLEAIRLNQEEWISRGGKAGKEQPVKKEDDWDKYAEALEELQARPSRNNADGEEEEEDEEYVPDDRMRGSASPEPGGEGASDEEDENSAALELLDDADEENSDQENAPVHRAPRRSIARPRHVVESDEDEDTENPPIRGPSFPSHSRSVLPVFSEDDRENGITSNEDKENDAVPRRGLFDSPQMLNLTRDEPMRASQPRSPFRDLMKDAEPVDDDPFGSTPLHPVAGPSRSPMQGSPLGHKARPAPMFDFGQDDDDDEPLGFSQMPEDVPAGSLLQPGFTQQFQSPSSLKKTSFSQFMTPDPDAINSINGRSSGGFDQMRAQADDRFSSPTQAILRPVLDVSTSLRRRADDLFEREQGALVAAAASKNANQKPTLFVNDSGFLTQTRPEGDNPHIYAPSPSPSQQTTAAHFQSDSGDLLESPSIIARTQPATIPATIPVTLPASPSDSARQPFSRLRRAGDPIPSPSPSPPVREKNIFDELMRNNEKQMKRKERAAKAKLEKSEFIAGEAVESDEDDHRGFGLGQKEADEEEDGDELDKPVEGLVDDAVMAEATQAENLVMEKFQEHQQADDAALEKLHRDAIEGKLRSKRRNRGLGMDDDSDDEDEDDRARELRRRMAKKRKIDNDNLEELAKNPATFPFYDSYQHKDDEDEFAHLKQGLTDVFMGETQEGDEETEEEEEGEEEVQEQVDVSEIRERVREMARSNVVPDEELDPYDVTWLADDVEEDEGASTRFKVINTKSKVIAHRDHDLDMPHLRPQKPTHAPQDKKMTAWAKGEGRTGNNNTGRAAVGSSVTGHKSLGGKAKAGGGSLRTAVPTGSVSARPAPKKPAKQPSMLAGALSRADRFS